MFLEIKGIKKSFGTGDSRVNVLKGLDLEIERGEFCVLLGPSGSGKSTLLNIIGGIDGADEGSITIDGEQLEDMTEKKLSLYRRKHLGYIFQMYNLIPNLTLRENIEVGAYLSDRPLDVDELMHTLGIYEHQNKLPSLTAPFTNILHLIDRMGNSCINLADVAESGTSMKYFMLEEK